VVSLPSVAWETTAFSASTSAGSAEACPCKYAAGWGSSVGPSAVQHPTAKIGVGPSTLASSQVVCEGNLSASLSASASSPAPTPTASVSVPAAPEAPTTPTAPEAVARARANGEQEIVLWFYGWKTLPLKPIPGGPPNVYTILKSTSFS
jgi:hypothetical protein